MQNPENAVAASFTAWLLEQTGRGIRGRFAQLDETMLDPGDVLIRVEYAAVSRRDANVGAGLGPVPRRLPCVGGSDLAGEVVESAAPRFKPGDKVIATGYGLGIKHHGAFAELALVPGGWVLPLPQGLTPADSMALGSSGLAVAMAITRLEEIGLRPERGPVLVSGAHADCGALAVALLAARGYEVVASSSYVSTKMWLVDLGASEVLVCDKPPSDAIRQKERALWAGAIDNLGGEELARVLRSAKPGAGVVALGSMSGAEQVLPVAPFVERGISLIGVDAIQASFASKEKAWARLASDLQTQVLAKLYGVVAFQELPAVFEHLLGGHIRGRTVVRITAKGSEKEGI